MGLWNLNRRKPREREVTARAWRHRRPQSRVRLLLAARVSASGGSEVTGKNHAICLQLRMEVTAIIVNGQNSCN